MAKITDPGQMKNQKNQQKKNIQKQVTKKYKKKIFSVKKNTHTKKKKIVDGFFFTRYI